MSPEESINKTMSGSGVVIFLKHEYMLLIHHCKCSAIQCVIVKKLLKLPLCFSSSFSLIRSKGFIYNGACVTPGVAATSFPMICANCWVVIRLRLSMFLQSSTILSHFSVVSLIAIVVKHRINPKNIILFVEIRTDLLISIVKPS